METLTIRQQIENTINKSIFYLITDLKELVFITENIETNLYISGFKLTVNFDFDIVLEEIKIDKNDLKSKLLNEIYKISKDKNNLQLLTNDFINSIEYLTVKSFV